MNVALNDAKKMKVVELKSTLHSLGASTSGLKAVLLERLLNILSKKEEEMTPEIATVASEGWFSSFH